MVDIPIQNLIKIDRESSTAVYSKLHHYGVIEMPKFVSDKHIPAYALENRELVTYCKDEDGVIKFSSDSELTDILEKAIEERLMDDNDDVILHIFCKYRYRSPLNFDDATNIRVAATEVVDTALQYMKSWVTCANQSLDKKKYSINKVRKDYGPEYDIVAELFEDNLNVQLH